MKNSMLFTLLGLSVVSVASFPVFVIAMNVAATPPGGDVAESVVRRRPKKLVPSSKKVVSSQLKTAIIPVDGEVTVPVELEKNPVQPVERLKKDVVPVQRTPMVVNNFNTQGAVLSDKQFEVFCTNLGKCIKDGINPPKIPTWWDSWTWWCMKAPIVAFGKIPVEFRLAVYAVMIYMYCPALIAGNAQGTVAAVIEAAGYLPHQVTNAAIEATYGNPQEFFESVAGFLNATGLF